MMKRLTEKEMAARYGLPPKDEENAVDEYLSALIKALPEPERPAGLVKSAVERLMLVHRQRVRYRRLIRWIIVSLMVVGTMTFFLAFHSLPSSVHEVGLLIIRYKWVCLFAIVVMTLSQYVDDVLLERQIKKQLAGS